MQELFFSRISESTTGYTFTPCVGYFTSPGIDTRQKGPLAFSVSSERYRQMWGEWNCLSFETGVGGIEPPSPRLTVRRSTVRPPLPLSEQTYIKMKLVDNVNTRTNQLHGTLLLNTSAIFWCLYFIHSPCCSRTELPVLRSPVKPGWIVPNIEMMF